QGLQDSRAEDAQLVAWGDDEHIGRRRERNKHWREQVVQRQRLGPNYTGLAIRLADSPLECRFGVAARLDPWHVRREVRLERLCVTRPWVCRADKAPPQPIGATAEL